MTNHYTLAATQVWQQLGSSASAKGVALISNTGLSPLLVRSATGTPPNDKGHLIPADGTGYPLPIDSGEYVYAYGTADAGVLVSL